MTFRVDGSIEELAASALLISRSSKYSRRPVNVEEAVDEIRLPTTRYYGSKRRPAPWLAQTFGSGNGSRVLDAFGGTASVSLLLRSLGYSVTYVDIFQFNVVVARALLSPVADVPSIEDFLSREKPTTGFVTTTFRNLYFTHAENRWLDGFLAALEEVKDPATRDTWMYCVFQACLMKRPYNLFHRANLSIRLNVVEAAFGNRTTWNTPFETLLRTVFGELQIARNLRPNGSKVTVLDATAVERVRRKFDLVYIDPPYFKENGRADSYLSRYHFLEGLARHQEWPDLVDYTHPLRVFKSQSAPNEWSNSTQLLHGVERIVSKHSNARIVMSYALGGSPPPRQNRCRLNRNAVGGADEGLQWHDTDKHLRIER